MCVVLKLLTSGKSPYEVTTRLLTIDNLCRKTYKRKFLPLGRFTKYERLVERGGAEEEKEKKEKEEIPLCESIGHQPLWSRCPAPSISASINLGRAQVPLTI